MTTPPGAKRAAIYLRVSRSDQRSSLQLDATTAIANQRGWPIRARFVDEGISGSHDRRPGFQSMLAAAHAGDFDVLLVYRADRLFRSSTELVRTIDELAAINVGFVSATEIFDTTTPNGRLLLQIVAAFAEFERNVLRERTRDGLAAARRRGAHLGRPSVEVPPDKLAAAAAARAQGRAWRAIAAELDVPERTLRRRVRDAAQTSPAVPA